MKEMDFNTLKCGFKKKKVRLRCHVKKKKLSENKMAEILSRELSEGSEGHEQSGRGSGNP